MATYAANRAKLLASTVPYATRHPVAYGTNGMGPPYGQAAATYFVGEMQQVGLTVNRTYIAWVNVNTANGVYDWTNPDMWYNTCVANGIQIIFQHIFTPSWAFTGVGTNWTHSNLPYADWPPYPGTDWDNFKAYHVAQATIAATRYPRAWIELWNEWNVPGIYARAGGSATTAPTPANYADLHAAVQAAYKAVNPTQKVVVGGLLRIDSATTGLSGVATVAPLKTAMDLLACTPDAVCIHPYMLGAPNSDPTVEYGPNVIGRTSYTSIKRFQAAMVAAGWGNVPTWITETSYIASQSNSQGGFNAGSEAQKALWNREEFDMNYYLYSRDAVGSGRSGVEVFCHYHLENYAAPTAPDYTGFYTGDPVGGPHTQLQSGQTIQDFMSRVTNRLSVPLLTSITATGPTSAIATHPIVGTYTATGTMEGGAAAQITPIWRTSDSSIVTVTTNLFTGVGTPVATGTPGTASIVAYTYAANRRPILSNPVVLTIDAQIPTVGTITPNPFAVAVSNSGTVTFSASYTDQGGSPITGQPEGSWSSSDPTNAPIDSVTGILTAVGVSANVVVTFTPTTGNTCTANGQVTLNPVLQITNAPSSLINVGAVLVTVTDGVNPVTGATLVISDPTKATANGQTLLGLGTSGTFTLKAQKASYDDSALATITCTGGGILDDKDVLGLSNGASVTSYTDLDGNVWANAVTPPTYATNDINGHSAIAFNGTNQFLRSNATVSRINGSGVTYAALIQPLSVSPSVNEQMLDNRDTTNSQGFVMGRNTGTLAHLLDYYTAPGTLTLRFDGTAMAVNNWVRVIDRITQGAQSRMLDGVVVGTSGADATYRNPTTNPPRATKGAGSAGTGNWAQMHLAAEILVNRAVTDVERLQIDTYLQAYQTII